MRLTQRAPDPSTGSGTAGGSLRVFRQFAWLEADSVKVALSRPTHQRVTPAVSPFLSSILFSKDKSMDFNATSTSRDKLLGQLLKASFVVSLLTFAILAIFKMIVPSARGGWSVIPIVDIILLSVLALCWICMLSIYSFQGWTKNTDEYYEWLVSLGLRRSSYSRFIDGLFPKWMYLWTVRTAPIIVLIVLCALGLYLLADSFGLMR